jgi:general stress protein YciG
MAGTKAGGMKAAQTNKERYGEEFYGLIGKVGGHNGTGHTFAHGKLDPAEAGRRGGKISRRGKKSE